ncbi:MAG: hypothetical protein QF593_05105, partial [Nitrospinota bacterium]|nr:hypothetical protein [Nitrospinota bacterium]
MSLSPLEEKVLAAVDAERSAHEEYLRGLIRIKSHTGMEGPGQRDILRKFQEMDLDVEEFVP